MKKLLLGLVLLSQISLSAAQTPISWHKKIAQTNEKEKYEVLIASDKSTSTELADTLQHQQIIGMNFDEVIQKYWEEILRKHMIQEINNFRQKNGVAGHLKENNHCDVVLHVIRIFPFFSVVCMESSDIVISFLLYTWSFPFLLVVYFLSFCWTFQWVIITYIYMWSFLLQQVRSAQLFLLSPSILHWLYPVYSRIQET